MNIFVYSDESGVFDCYHRQYFVFGGIVYLDKKTRDESARRYVAVESAIRSETGIPSSEELKASNLHLNSKHKRRLLYVTNNEFRFGIVVKIQQLRIRQAIADNKKSRQRFMDYAYKIGVKRLFQRLIQDGVIDPDSVENLYFFVDEHNTATDGIYELQETLLQEFIHGTINFDAMKSFPALFPKAKSLQLQYRDSQKVTLIRAADIVANKIFHLALSGNLPSDPQPTFFVTTIP